MPMPRKPDPEKYCEACGKRMVRKVEKGEAMIHFKRRKFCDQKCMAKGFKGRWKENIVPRQGRYRARSITPKEACEACGSRRNLDVHHRDENPLNNEPENLTVLCRSCHMKEHRPRPTCSVDGCGRTHKGRGYCDMHYQRWVKHGDPLATAIPPRKKCRVCGEPAHAKGLCGKHYMQEKRGTLGQPERTPSEAVKKAWETRRMRSGE